MIGSASVKNGVVLRPKEYPQELRMLMIWKMLWTDPAKRCLYVRINLILGIKWIMEVGREWIDNLWLRLVLR